jgi:hypothetical protein
MRCEYCGQRIKDDWWDCFGCGAPVPYPPVMPKPYFPDELMTSTFVDKRVDLGNGFLAERQEDGSIRVGRGVIR